MNTNYFCDSCFKYGTMYMKCIGCDGLFCQQCMSLSKNAYCSDEMDCMKIRITDYFEMNPVATLRPRTADEERLKNLAFEFDLAKWQAIERLEKARGKNQLFK